MAFADKVDYVGLATQVSGIALRSNGQNATNQVLQIPGQDGSIIGDEIFGHIKAPTCEYAITGSAALTGLKLGYVYNSSGPFALNHIHVATGAGTEPVVTADAVQIEPSATQAVCTYSLDSVALSPARHALTFGAFTYSESTSLALQNAEFDATCTLDPTTINGDPVAADAVAGVETVNATFWAASETSAPAVSAATGWHITQDWNCTGADSQLFVWTATFTKYLSATQAS